MPEPTREEILDWDRRHVWHPATQMAEYEPLVIERADGCALVLCHNKKVGWAAILTAAKISVAFRSRYFAQPGSRHVSTTGVVPGAFLCFN